MPNPARSSIGSSVADGDRLSDVDIFNLTQQTQQLGLAAAVHDLADVTARQTALLDLQLIGINVIEAVFLFQVVAEISETSGQNGRLVSHTLENGHQALQPLGDRQVAGDLLHHRNVESPKQGDAARETLGKVDLAPHGALGNGPHFGTHAGTVGQLVDHLGFDQRGIHIETDQASAAAEDVVLLERNIDPLVGQLHEAFLQYGLIAERTAHRKLDAGAGGTVLLLERHTARKSLDRVDVESLFGDRFGDPCDMARRNLTSQKSDNIAVLALTTDPGLVMFLGDGGEADHHAQFRGLEKQLLEDGARFVGGGHEQDAQSQRLVDIRLADIEDERVVPGQNIGQRRGHAGLVFARNIDLDYLYLTFHSKIR